MTHEEAQSLLPSYALGALEDSTELKAHLDRCDPCSARLASYLETTARLGEAVETVEPPASLRESILSHRVAPITTAPRTAWLSRRVSQYVLATLAALLVVALGLSAVVVGQRHQLQSAQSELALDQQGLALLTSTETTVERLQPVPPLGGDSHGHWYHRPGIPTQVLVIEFMPRPPVGQAYVGWLEKADGSWRATGPFTLDAQGYGRIILVGDDGTRVRAVMVTRQSGDTVAPAGATVLRWPTP